MMSDAQGWIARVRREDPPELWERSLHLARAATLDEIKDQLVNTEGMEIIEVLGYDADAATQVGIEVDLLRAPTNDMVRMYLKEIGRASCRERV